MANSEHRLAEMLGVLKKHQITKGLTPVKFREILEDLGPTYVKLGQIMSMRSDMLPENYCQELTLLRTDVTPMPFETVKQLLNAELKLPMDEFFSSVDPRPLGSASIAQVHTAVLKDGSKAVIKIQRPAIREKMCEDIKLLKKAAAVLKITIGTEDLIDFNAILDELWETTQEEMDFIQEARNLDRFYNNQKDIVYISCPKVIHELTTPRLLVMERIEGTQIDQVEVLTSLGYSMTEIGEKTAENYCKQVLEDGFFHADPHPGNLWVSGGNIVWLDLGMTGTLSQSHKQLLKTAITAILENDIYTLKNVLLAFGDPRDRINHSRLYTDIDDIVSRYLSMDFGEMKLGSLIERLLELVKSHRIAITPDVTLLCRSMITMEGTLALCSPEVNLLKILSTHMAALMIDELDLRHLLIRKGRKAYTSLDKSLDIPSQLSDLLNITKNGQAKINVELSDLQEGAKKFSHTIDKLVLCLLSVGFFIGSAILSGFRADIPLICGIPWISFLGFFLSGVFLVWTLIKMHRSP